MMVTYGNASGPVPAIEPLLLNQKGSLFLTRPTLAHHCTTREELNWRAGDVLNGIASGDLQLHIHKTYPLSAAREAHEDLAARRTTGKLLLDVNV
jgi:NADPH:quinone reductase